MGYKNKTERVEFPDMSEDDDLIWIQYRNPKLLTPDFFDGGVDLPDPPNTEGMTEEQKNALLREHNKKVTPLLVEQSRSVLANLIVDWHVYDATVDEATEPLGKPSAETVALLPLEIIQRMNEIVQATTNPTKGQAQSAS